MCETRDKAVSLLLIAGHRRNNPPGGRFVLVANYRPALIPAGRKTRWS
jgi:hypothetical protein